jgi:predicted S18 family serine protease
MSMLPKTHYKSQKELEEEQEGETGPTAKQLHEPINDISVHRYTMQQLFIPTAESRDFTRADAAKAFHETLKPADERVPLPELIDMERDKLNEVPEEEATAKYEQAVTLQAEQAARRAMQRIREEEARYTKVQAGRFEFRFKDVNADVVGRHGKHPDGIGWRYGAPHQDRKRGMSKIPKQVP